MPDRTGVSAAKVCARCAYSIAVFLSFSARPATGAHGRHKPLALKRNSSGTVICRARPGAASGHRRVANMKRNAVQQQAPARKARKQFQIRNRDRLHPQCPPRQRYQDNATKTARGGPAITRRGKAAMAMVKRPAKSASRKSTSRKPAAKSVMLPTDRLAYSPITDRAPLKLPNGARMAVWVVINVEEWDATQPMPRTVITPPAGGAPMPDVPNWAWHEYGNRVGFWRFVEIFDAFAIPGVLAINGSALAAYPQIVRAAVERNWEFMGHGFTQRNLQKVADE